MCYNSNICDLHNLILFQHFTVIVFLFWQLLQLCATSNNGISGTWEPLGNCGVLLVSGTYTFTPTSGVCATTATLTVTVNPNITLTFVQSSSFCANATAPILPTLPLMEFWNLNPATYYSRTYTLHQIVFVPSQLRYR
jgi:hypothetical protein